MSIWTSRAIPTAVANAAHSFMLAISWGRPAPGPTLPACPTSSALLGAYRHPVHRARVEPLVLQGLLHSHHLRVRALRRRARPVTHGRGVGQLVLDHANT